VRAVHERRSKKIKAIMDAKDEELFGIKRFRMKPPCGARIFQSLKCARCGEKTMETRITMMGGRPLCRPCFERERAKCGR
jgi:formylmethanofuran dehydrogenase subunit E